MNGRLQAPLGGGRLRSLKRERETCRWILRPPAAPSERISSESSLESSHSSASGESGGAEEPRARRSQVERWRWRQRSARCWYARRTTNTASTARDARRSRRRAAGRDISGLHKKWVQSGRKTFTKKEKCPVIKGAGPPLARRRTRLTIGRAGLWYAGRRDGAACGGRGRDRRG